MLREFLERPEITEICELRGRFGLMAIHGGNLERATDVIAREVARRTGGSLYAVVQDAPHREHLSSLAFDPTQSPALARFLDHVDVTIAVHGYGRSGYWHHLLLGGTNRRLARHVAHHLRDGLPACYRVVDELSEIPRLLRGQHARNPVNAPRQRGVQIELPPTIRWNREEHGWSDHAGVSRAPHVDRLIGALARAVGTWKAGTAEPYDFRRIRSASSGWIHRSATSESIFSSTRRR